MSIYKQTYTAPSPSPPPHKSVIFGTSITERIDPNLLINGNVRKCINISNSGDKIIDIIKRVESFYSNPTTNPMEIEKVILSFGTNDIRFHRGVHHLKSHIIELVQKCKNYFPTALIYVQSVLPIKIRRNFIGFNFTSFNNMLFNICATEHCYFLDIFNDFVAQDWMYYNRFLFRDDLHLNRAGIVRLTYWFRCVINKDNSFNPLVH